MKKNLFAVASLVFVGALSLTSCKKEGCTDSSILIANFDPEAKKDDGSCINRYTLKEGETLVSGNIKENTTWTSDEVWVLPSRIAVESGAILTIEPGTVIKGVEGSGANASALLVAQGAKIMAEGTKAKPIIFTTTDDEIASGFTSVASPNVEQSVNGKWGGLIILGKASISADAPTAQIEGIPASDINGLYGGNLDDDNSGVLSYVSVRHGGANIGEGNEINGITFGGVGTGTTVDHIEVVGNQDDGVEFFGGTVNASEVIVMNAGDDAVDGDQGYSGTVSNVIIICSGETDHAFEIDGPEGVDGGTMNVQDGTVLGSATAELGQFRDSALINMSDVVFALFTDTADGRGDLGFKDDASIDNFVNGRANFSNLQYLKTTELWELDEIFKNELDDNASFETVPSVGADSDEFNDWSWAKEVFDARMPN